MKKVTTEFLFQTGLSRFSKFQPYSRKIRDIGEKNIIKEE